jgi:hypothetical protein
MKITVHLVVCDDDGHEETFTDVVVLEKACQRIEHLGLTLLDGNEMGLARLVWPDGPGAQGFSAGRCHTQRDPCGQKTRNHRSSRGDAQLHGKAGDRWPIQGSILSASWHAHPEMEGSILRDSNLSRFAHGC